jgi:hypothetical protein
MKNENLINVLNVQMFVINESNDRIIIVKLSTVEILRFY